MRSKGLTQKPTRKTRSDGAREEVLAVGGLKQELVCRPWKKRVGTFPAGLPAVGREVCGRGTLVHLM